MGRWNRCPYPWPIRISAPNFPRYTPLRPVGLSVSLLRLHFLWTDLAVFLDVDVLFEQNSDKADTLPILIAVFFAHRFAPAHKDNLEKGYRNSCHPRIPNNVAYSVGPCSHNSALLDLWAAKYSQSVRPAEVFPDSTTPWLPRLNFLHLFLFLLLLSRIHNLFLLRFRFSLLLLNDFTQLF